MYASAALRIGPIAAAIVALLAGCGSDDTQPAASPSHGETVLKTAGCNGKAPTCPGAAAPTLKMVNKQDDGLGFKKESTYAVADFAGKPTLVALLQGW